MDNVITSPSVALIMGSKSDWETMKFSEETLLTLKTTNQYLRITLIAY